MSPAQPRLPPPGSSNRHSHSPCPKHSTSLPFALASAKGPEFLRPLSALLSPRPQYYGSMNQVPKTTQNHDRVLPRASQHPPRPQMQLHTKLETGSYGATGELSLPKKLPLSGLGASTKCPCSSHHLPLLSPGELTHNTIPYRWHNMCPLKLGHKCKPTTCVRGSEHEQGPHACSCSQSKPRFCTHKAAV